MAIIMVLVHTSPDINKQNHGFIRIFITHGPRLFKSMPVTGNCKYIAGVQPQAIYFSSMKPGQIERLDLTNGHTKSIAVVNNPILLHQLSASCQAEVNGPYIRLFDPPSGLIITANEPSPHIQVHPSPQLFTRFVSVAPDQIFLRKFVRKDQAFYMYNLKTQQFSDSLQITDEKTDGGLSTDGELVYDPSVGTIAYVERNCNKITLLDTARQVFKVAHSIDTFNTNLFQTNERGGTVTNNAPVQYVNQSASFDNGILYVQSGVRADNQSQRDFNNELVIDRYDGKDGTYIGSIRLEDVKDGIRNWIVRNQHLYLLRNSRLYIYSL